MQELRGGCQLANLKFNVFLLFFFKMNFLIFLFPKTDKAFELNNLHFPVVSSNELTEESLILALSFKSFEK
jgi:hypothetical protein